jgi:UDP-glucose 4-epimerase
MQYFYVKKFNLMIEINGCKVQTILVTGAAGLIGASFVKYLNFGNQVQSSTHNWKMIVGIDAMEQWGNDNVVPENHLYKFYKMNCSSEKLEELFKEYNFDYVYHFAAYAAEGLSPFMRKFNYENNILSTVNIINNCIKYKTTRLVYTSSMSVYGNGVRPGEKFDEKDLPLPLDPYAISKYACELDIQSAGLQHGLDWCIIRPHNVYGIGQNIFDRYRNVLGIWMYQHLNGEPLTVYGSGEQTRAFSYIDDTTPCLWAAATYKEASKQIINVGGTKACTINEAKEMMLEVFGWDAEVVYKEARYEVKHAVPSYQKSIDLLDYADNHGLEVGLRKMWNWAKTLTMRDRFKWPEYEINKGLYSYWK